MQLKITLILMLTGLIAPVAHSQSVQMDVDGAVQINHAGEDTPNSGTTRWTGCDFQVFNGSKWISLTKGNADHQFVESQEGSKDELGIATETDGMGNVYMAGTFSSDTLIFPNDTLYNLNGTDIFIAKYNEKGDHIWTRGILGDGFDKIESITINSDGELYVIGYFNGSFLHLSGITIGNAGTSNFFVAKYLADGSCVWARIGSGITHALGIAICADQENNVIITGRFLNDTLKFPGTTLLNHGGNEIFIAKYSPMGDFQWATNPKGKGTDICTAINTDHLNNIYLNGYFSSDSLIFPGDTLTTTGTSDILLAKYSPNGQFLWAKKIGGTAGDFSQDLSLDQSGSLYITGYYFSNTITLPDQNLINNGGADVLLIKLDLDGNIQWAISQGGSMDDFGASLATNNSGEVIIVGTFRSTSFPFPGMTLSNAGLVDIFYAIYSENGNFNKAESFGNLSNDIVQDIDFDHLGYFYITGYYDSNQITFPSSTLINQGFNDAYLIKFER